MSIKVDVPPTVSLTSTHALTARATDNLGVSTTSAAVTIRVDAPPGVSITAPANNAVFAAPANITVTASASDADGTVAKVDFFDGATLVGTATAAPYGVTLANVAAGAHSYSARATDNQGASTTSAAVGVTVDAAPAVNLTAPAPNAVYAAPGNVTLTATATDSVGTIAKVDFYQGTTLIGTSTAAPYSFNWTGVAAGPYSLTAVATNDAGMTTTSSAVAITVDAAPSVAISNPASGASFTAPANVPIAASASDTAGTVTKVDFYQGGTLITTLTAAPYSFTWTGVPAGSYSLTAVATNDAGETTTSTAIAITVRSAVAQMYYIQVDHLNTPRLVADSTGTTVWRWDQGEPFGNDVPNNNPSGLGAFDFPLRFPGQYFDREINTVYNVRRDYDPSIGRYVQSDPVGLGAGLNTYLYVSANPLSFIDPYGLRATVLCTRCRGTAGPMVCTSDEDGNSGPSFTTNMGTNETSLTPGDPFGTNGPISSGDYDLPNAFSPQFNRVVPSPTNTGRPGQVRTPSGTTRSGIRIHAGTISQGCLTTGRGQTGVETEGAIRDLVNRNVNTGGTTLTIEEQDCNGCNTCPSQ